VSGFERGRHNVILVEEYRQRVESWVLVEADLMSRR